MTASDTVRDALAATAARFAAAGVEEPRADAEVLLAHVLETDRTGLVVRASQPVPAASAARLEDLVRRREAREPVFQLVGRREFWSFDVAVDRRVLCPRPESELLVETVVGLAPDARRILDCGTGSGALAAALPASCRAPRSWRATARRKHSPSRPRISRAWRLGCGSCGPPGSRPSVRAASR
jgi:release factor glutamine methyltransferase